MAQADEWSVDRVRKYYRGHREVGAAVIEAMQKGFRAVPTGSGHLRLLCPYAGRDSDYTIVSHTPRDDTHAAERVRRFVQNCEHWSRG